MGAQPPFALVTERLGPLPLLNHFLATLGLDALLDQCVPTTDPRCPLRYGTALGVLVRSLLIEREPIYRHHETVSAFAAEAFGLAPQEVPLLRDDQLGRALDRLFDADRGTVMTRLVVAMVRRLALRLNELHNDSTTVRFTGQYRRATGRSIRGRRAPWMTYGYSKDHRPDLKQLLLVLTSTRDGAVPVAFRAADGNTNDTTTHLDTWTTLCQATGRPDFLYVADSTLCATEVLETIDRQGGRFVTVLPRSRREDAQFRRWIQRHPIDWELVIDRAHPRRRRAPRDRWWVTRAPLPSLEGYPVIWVKSALLALAQHTSRHERIAAASEELEALDRVLLTGRGRRPKTPAAIQDRVAAILARLHVRAYLTVAIRAEPAHRFRQTRRGRPSADTRYRRETRYRFRLERQLNAEAIAAEQASDGMYPLLTNDRTLTPRQVLEAHKRQPALEKRFAQLKAVHEIAPVLLKNEARVEAFFFLYCLALCVAGLIEREVRRGMHREGLEELPLYPEHRACRRPTYEQILRLFAHAERHTLRRRGRLIEVFHPQLTPLQRQVLHLLGVPTRAYGPQHLQSQS
jgi:transposase